MKYLRKLKHRFLKVYKKYFEEDIDEIIKKFNVKHKFNAKYLVNCSDKNLNIKFRKVKNQIISKKL